MRRFWFTTAFALACGGVSANAQAQSTHLSTDHPLFQNEGRQARVTLRIPFGANGPFRANGPLGVNGQGDARMAPQIDFSIRQGVRHEVSLDDWRFHRPDAVETRLGFTLSDDPLLMLNGQSVTWAADGGSAGDDVLELGKGGKIGLGVGAAVIVGAAIFVAVMIDGQSGPDNSGG